MLTVRRKLLNCILCKQYLPNVSKFVKIENDNLARSKVKEGNVRFIIYIPQKMISKLWVMQILFERARHKESPNAHLFWISGRCKGRRGQLGNTHNVISLYCTYLYHGALEVQPTSRNVGEISFLANTFNINSIGCGDPFEARLLLYYPPINRQFSV
jgi:hypothetical protein